MVPVFRLFLDDKIIAQGQTKILTSKNNINMGNTTPHPPHPTTTHHRPPPLFDTAHPELSHCPQICQIWPPAPPPTLRLRTHSPTTTTTSTTQPHSPPHLPPPLPPTARCCFQQHTRNRAWAPLNKTNVFSSSFSFFL